MIHVHGRASKPPRHLGEPSRCGMWYFNCTEASAVFASGHVGGTDANDHWLTLFECMTACGFRLPPAWEYIPRLTCCNTHIHIHIHTHTHDVYVHTACADTLSHTRRNVCTYACRHACMHACCRPCHVDWTVLLKTISWCMKTRVAQVATKRRAVRSMMCLVMQRLHTNR